jgi:hypothetical protein
VTRHVTIAALAAALVGAPAAASQTEPAPRDGPIGRLSASGVLRATAAVDSVFIERTVKRTTIEAGDWASYLLARLGGHIPDSLGLVVAIDTAAIEVRGRFQDVPPEARALLGPLAAMVDSSTTISADVRLQRTGREVIRFWLRSLTVNGFQIPEFVLASMMAKVGRQYPALTETGRDLYVQVPADGSVTLGTGVVVVATPPGP